MIRDPLGVLSGLLAAVVRDHFTLMVSEKQSHLGRDWHVQAVLRRIACGEPGAVMVDGKYLLSVEAHDEEMAMIVAACARKKRISEPPTGASHV